MVTPEIVVVGGGIAGVSVAAELAARYAVTLLEREPELAYHTTGRSAAMFLESYGSPEIRAVTQVSRPLIDAVPHPVLTPRPEVFIARADQVAALDALLDRLPWLERLDTARAVALCPPLRPTYVAAAALDPTAREIDVLGLHQHYLRTARERGAQVLTRAGVRAGSRHAGTWRLDTDAGEIAADIVVNATGAWGDEFARRCGVPALGLRPLRRTAAVARVSGVDRSWPLVICVDEEFYFRPEGAGILLSPGDETPSEAVDARADDLDVALAIERVNAATTLGVRSIQTAWAGLRTFLADRNPAVGFDPAHDGFFWLVGQGGYGIQTAPGLAALAAALIEGGTARGWTAEAGLDLSRLAPRRLASW